jgi:hypothetical protein
MKNTRMSEFDEPDKYTSRWGKYDVGDDWADSDLDGLFETIKRSLDPDATEAAIVKAIKTLQLPSSSATEKIEAFLPVRHRIEKPLGYFIKPDLNLLNPDPIHDVSKYLKDSNIRYFTDKYWTDASFQKMLVELKKTGKPIASETSKKFAMRKKTWFAPS